MKVGVTGHGAQVVQSGDTEYAGKLRADVGVRQRWHGEKFLLLLPFLSPWILTKVKSEVHTGTKWGKNPT